MNSDTDINKSRKKQRGFSIGEVLGISVIILPIAMLIMIFINGQSQKTKAYEKAYAICQAHGDQFNPELVDQSNRRFGSPANLIIGGHGVSVICVSKSGEFREYVDKF